MAELVVPVTSAEEVHRITDAVLARPEFLESRPSWLQQAGRRINDVINDFLNTLGEGTRGSTIGTLTLVLLALLVVFLVLRYTRTMRRDPGLDVAVEGPVGRAAAQWLADAEAAAAAGDWRQALRCRYRALVADFAANGLVEEVPGRTTGEYLRVVEENVPAAAEAFAVATRTFEAAWYGHADVQAADVEAFAATAHRSVVAAGLRRPATVGA